MTYGGQGKRLGPSLHTRTRLSPLSLSPLTFLSLISSPMMWRASSARPCPGGAGARGSNGSPESAAYSTVRRVLLDAFGKTRAPTLLPAVLIMIADDRDGGSDAAAAALLQQLQAPRAAAPTG